MVGSSMQILADRASRPGFEAIAGSDHVPTDAVLLAEEQDGIRHTDRAGDCAVQYERSGRDVNIIIDRFIVLDQDIFA